MSRRTSFSDEISFLISSSRASCSTGLCSSSGASSSSWRAPCQLSLLLWISLLHISSLWVCPAPPQLLLYPHVQPTALQLHSLQCKIYNIVFKNIFVLLECQHYHLADGGVTTKRKKDSKDKGKTKRRENNSKE